jgi:hypothetical protein
MNSESAAELTSKVSAAVLLPLFCLRRIEKVADVVASPGLVV